MENPSIGFISIANPELYSVAAPTRPIHIVGTDGKERILEGVVTMPDLFLHLLDRIEKLEARIEALTNFVS